MQFNRAQAETHVSLLHQISNKNQEICGHTQQKCKQNCTGTSATQETGNMKKRVRDALPLIGLIGIALYEAQVTFGHTWEGG